METTKWLDQVMPAPMADSMRREREGRMLMMNPLGAVNWPNRVRSQKIQRTQEGPKCGSQDLVRPNIRSWGTQYLVPEFRCTEDK